MPVFELLAYFGTPLAAAWIARRNGFGWLDPVLTCYGVGLILANLPITIDPGATQTLTEVAVPLAIPLLLFQTDFVRWLHASRATIIGFTIAIFATLTSLLISTALFRGATPDLWMSTGMLTGAWTGGSPNLMSVAAALDAPQTTMVLTNASDIFVGGIYLFALLTFARGALARVLPVATDIEPLAVAAEEEEPLGLRVKEGALSLVLAAAIVAASAGLSLAAFGEMSAPAVILGITTGGVLASFSARVRALRASYDVGNYLILVFCTAIGALTDLGALMEGGTTLLGFTATGLVLTLVIHYSACALAKIDVDTAIITSVATIMGPPLVVPVARRLDNRGAFVSGITSGLVGYALANYLGLAMAAIARDFLS